MHVQSFRIIIIVPLVEKDWPKHSKLFRSGPSSGTGRAWSKELQIGRN